MLLLCFCAVAVLLGGGRCSATLRVSPLNGGGGVRQVAKYFMVDDDSSLGLEYAVTDRFVLTAGSSVEDVRLMHNLTWVVKRGGDWKPLREGQQPIVCKVFREYNQDATAAEGKKVEVSCSSTLLLSDVNKHDEGTYGCFCEVVSSLEGGKVLSVVTAEESVQIFVVVPAVGTIVVTFIVVTAMIVIGLVGICCRLAGHRFSWEYEDLGQGSVASHNQSRSMSRASIAEEGAYYFSRHSRYSSNASNISGLVMQTDPEAMARLMERLDHVEDTVSELSMDCEVYKDNHIASIKEEEQQQLNHESVKEVDSEATEMQQQPNAFVRSLDLAKTRLFGLSKSAKNSPKLQHQQKASVLNMHPKQRRRRSISGVLQDHLELAAVERDRKGAFGNHPSHLGSSPHYYSLIRSKRGRMQQQPLASAAEANAAELVGIIVEENSSSAELVVAPVTEDITATGGNEGEKGVI